MGRKEPYPGTQAIRRAGGLLKAFTDARSEWTLAELSAAVGLSKATVYAGVGAAMRNHDGRPLAAIAVGAPTSRLTGKRISELGELVRLSAERISRRLGAAVVGAGGPMS